MKNVWLNSEGNELTIPYTILDFGFKIVKALPVGSFTNSNVASLNPNGITRNIFMPEASLTLPDDFIKIASSKSDSTVLAKTVF